MFIQKKEQRRIVSIEPIADTIIERLASQSVSVDVIDRSEDMNALISEKEPEVLICRDRDDVAGIIEFCPSVKLIFTVEVGVEELPFQLLLSKEIRVANTSGISADIMSNYTLACILGQCARTKENILNQQNRNWKRYQCTDSLQGKELLIVGAGRTGKEIARKAKVFDMKTIGVQRRPRPSVFFDRTIGVDCLDQELPMADFVVCTIPQTPLTEQLFDKGRFNKMKQGSVFINISRGAIVVEEDLVAVLDTGKIAQAYLDVFEKEPLPKTSSLWTHPKVQITPHQSGRLTDYMSRAMDMFVENYQAFVRGEMMPNEVDLSQGY